MTLQELLTETVETPSIECWDEESTRRPSGRSGCDSIRGTVAAGDDRRAGAVRRRAVTHQAVFQWTHRLTEHLPDSPRTHPRRVAVDETAVQIGTEWCWLYAAIDLDSKLLLGVRLSPRCSYPSSLIDV